MAAQLFERLRASEPLSPVRLAAGVLIAFYGAPRVAALARAAVERIVAQSCELPLPAEDGATAGGAPASESAKHLQSVGGGGGSGGEVAVPRRRRARPSVRLACSSIPFLCNCGEIAARAAVYGAVLKLCFGVNTADLLRGIGASGAVAIYFLQDVLSNLWSGVLLVVSAPFAIGDRVSVRAQMMNHDGVVHDMTLREGSPSPVPVLDLAGGPCVSQYLRLCDRLHQGAAGRRRRRFHPQLNAAKRK